MTELKSTSVSSVVREFVDNDLAGRVNRVLTDAKVPIGTVHFTLAYIIATDVGMIESEGEFAISLLSLERFMYEIAIAAREFRIEHQRRDAGAPN